MVSLKSAWATQQDPGFLDKSSGREQLLNTPTSGAAKSSTKAEAAWLRAEHDFHTNYFHSVQDVSRRISSQSFTGGFDSLHTFYGFEVHGYHHFRTKEKLTGKVMASLEELEAVMFTLFVLCFFAFKFACLDFFFLLLSWATL